MTAADPKLCVIINEACWHSFASGCENWVPMRCHGCNGDGTRTVHTPVPDGSVLLSAEQADTAAAAVRYVLDGCWAPRYDPALLAALDALGVDRG